MLDKGIDENYYFNYFEGWFPQENYFYCLENTDVLLFNFLVIRPGIEFWSWIKVGILIWIPANKGIPEL